MQLLTRELCRGPCPFTTQLIEPRCVGLVGEVCWLAPVPLQLVYPEAPKAHPMQTRIAGIPCEVRLTYLHTQPAQSWNDASDWDHNGYTDVEFGVFDRKGYPAAWLEAKLADEERRKIEDELVKEAKEYNL